MVSGLPRFKALILLWAPVLLWAGFIFYLSSIPHLRITLAWYDIVLRKLAHVFVFGVLALLAARALSGSTSRPKKTILLASFLLTVLYACSDEYHQSFVEGRQGSWLDIAIDSAGAWFALRFRG